MIACSFSEILSICQVRLMKIQEKSLHSVDTPKDCIGMQKIAVCDAVQCNDGAQGTRKIFIRKTELDS